MSLSANNNGRQQECSWLTPRVLQL